MLVVALAAIAAASVAPVSAKAAVPCRDRIYNDWYPDGKIKTTYPISCYRDALKHIKADALAYSSLADDIRSAMQAALAREHGHKSVPAQVGKGGPAEPRQTASHSSHSTKSSTSSSTDSSSSGPQQVSVSETLPASTTASGQTGGGRGIPVPLLVLGGLALLLVAVGAAGLVAKRRRDTA